MAVQDTLLYFVHSAFIALSIISIIEYLRYGGAIRRDMALMLTSIGLPISRPLLEVLLPGQMSLLMTLGSLALMIQPYQMLRLLAHFQNIPKLISRVAILAVIFSSLSILISGSDLPGIIIFLIVSYFVSINGYVMQVFIRKASSTTGVSHWRLQFAAIGAGLFALAFLILGFSIILLELNQIIILLLLSVIFASAIAFYLGLTPFRWLRQTWQLRELEQFVVQLAATKVLTNPIDVYAILCQLAQDATGTQKAVILVSQDQEKEWLEILRQKPAEALIQTDTIGILHRVKKPTVIGIDELSSEEQNVLGIDTEHHVYVVPIEGKQYRWGQLIVYLEQGSLFVEDDLNLLKMYVEQISTLLENIYILAERDQHTQQLETIVVARTKDLRQHNLYLKLMQDVSVIANEASSLDEPLQNAIQLICNTLDFSLAHIHTPDKNGTDQLRPGSIWYLDQDQKYEAFQNATLAFPLSIQLEKIEQVLRMSTAIWTNKLTDDAHFTRAEVAREAGLQTGVFVPLYIGTKIVAVMEFFSNEVLQEDPTLIDLLLQMGTQLGRVVERQRAKRAIQERESRFRSIFEQAAVGIAEVALDGTFRQVNQRFCEIVGYSRKDLLALHFQDITHPEDLEEDLKQIQTLLEDNLLRYSLQKRYYHKTGRIIWVNLTVSVVRNKAEQAQHFITVVEDITAQRDAETRFARVLDTTTEAVITIESSQEIILFNQSAEKIFGYAREEALGQTLDMLLPDDVISSHQQYVHAFANGHQDIARGMGQRDRELFAKRKDGHVFPIEASISKLTEGDEVILTVFIRDISEHKEATEALRESEGRYHRIIDNMLEGFQIIDFNWEYLYVNQSAADHGRLSKDELLGHSMMEKYPGIETTEMFAILKRCMKERVAQHAEFEFVYPDKTSAWFELRVQPIPEGIFVLSLLINERKEVEQAMQELNEQLEQRVKERTAHLEAVNGELEAFSYSVSHDLRAPLRALDGFSQAIVEDYRDLLDEDGQKYLDLIRFESQRMGQLIDDLIDLSRFTRTDLHQEWIDLSDIAQEISQKLQAQDTQRNGNFIIQPDLVTCADTRLMRLVLENLLGNAWKYTSKQTQYRIEFGSSEENGEVVYFVRDNGAGFDMAYVHKLFGAFQRLHAATEYEGTGIGLATVQRIIHRHGGNIRAEGVVNEGASFYFTIGQGQCEG